MRYAGTRAVTKRFGRVRCNETVESRVESSACQWPGFRHCPPLPPVPARRCTAWSMSCPASSTSLHVEPPHSPHSVASPAALREDRDLPEERRPVLPDLLRPTKRAGRMNRLFAAVTASKHATKASRSCSLIACRSRSDNIVVSRPHRLPPKILRLLLATHQTTAGEQPR